MPTFSPDGRWLAISGIVNENVLVYDESGGQPIVLGGHPDLHRTGHRVDRYEPSDAEEILDALALERADPDDLRVATPLHGVELVFGELAEGGEVRVEAPTGRGKTAAAQNLRLKVTALEQKPKALPAASAE